MIYNNISKPLVVKSIHPYYADTLFPVEKKVYERFTADATINTNTHKDEISLARPGGLLRYYGVHSQIQNSIILEYAEGGNLHDFLFSPDFPNHMPMQNRKPLPSKQLLYKWATQASLALEYAHSLGIYHSDIHTLNFFLSAPPFLDLKVGDWAGAVFDGVKRSPCSYRYSHRLFTSEGIDVSAIEGVSVKTEIFAFGSALFVMIAGAEVWDDLEDGRDNEEIKRRIVQGNLPQTQGLRVLGGVVEGCWKGRFDNMAQIVEAIKEERRRYNSSTTSRKELVED